MEKRYQVFVSSTYTDLMEERYRVIQSIMELDCIPAGMEVFPAIDEEQFNFIKRIIDDCDYYLLIIGGRYGSVSEAGISYTEMEYDYAISKGIKVIAFIHSDPNSIPVNKSEMNETFREKLEAFRTKVSTGRLIRKWKDIGDLPGLVMSSLSKTIKTYPAEGWVRASNIPSLVFSEELALLTRENRELKEELERVRKNKITAMPKIKVLANDSDQIHIKIEKIREWSLCLEVDESEFSPKYLTKLPDNYIEKYNKSVRDNIELADEYNQEVRLYKNKGAEIEFSVTNVGTVKTNLLYVDIKTPNGISIFNFDSMPEKHPTRPKEILDHPFNEAMKSYMPKKPSGLSLLNIDAIDRVPFLKIPRIVPHNNNKWQTLKGNVLQLFRQELLHTRTSTYDKVIFTASQPGQYELEISCICEEFQQPVTHTMIIVASE